MIIHLVILLIFLAYIDLADDFGVVSYYLISYLFMVYWAAIILPTWAVTVRRLHDIGKSGWVLLINIIPGIGTLLLLCLLTNDSESDTNLYGPNPKSI